MPLKKTSRMAAMTSSKTNCQQISNHSLWSTLKGRYTRGLPQRPSFIWRLPVEWMIRDLMTHASFNNASFVQRASWFVLDKTTYYAWRFALFWNLRRVRTQFTRHSKISSQTLTYVIKHAPSWPTPFSLKHARSTKLDSWDLCTVLNWISTDICGNGVFE